MIIITPRKTKEISFAIWSYLRPFITVSNFTLVVLIGTWIAYLRANALSEKSLRSSKAPWISVSDFVPVVKNEEFNLHYKLENHSDSPAIHIRTWIGLTSNNKPTIWASEPEQNEYSLMPRETRHPVIVGGFVPPKVVTHQLEDGTVSLKCIMCYSDVFNRWFIITTNASIADGDAIGEKHSTVTGIKLELPKDF